MIEMHLELEDVKGESEFKGAKDAMEVLAFSWAIGLSLTRVRSTRVNSLVWCA